MRRIWRLSLVVLVLTSCAGCDQATKSIARRSLVSSPVSLLNDSVRFEYTENLGAFLGLGSSLPREGRLLLLVVLTSASLLLALAFTVSTRSLNVGQWIGLSLLVGGGLGNLIDRIFNDGAVIDFVRLGVGSLQTGVFNLADVAIVVGAIVLLLGSARERRGTTTGCDILEPASKEAVRVEERCSMSAHVTHPTPYPDVNAVLHLLLSSVQTVLGNHFIGMYVHGSLANGDFDPQRSDIDFFVVTADELPDEMLPALEAMHARVAASGLKWAAKLEGSYIPQQALRRYDPSRARHPWLGVDGHFAVEQLGSDWVIQRHIIREQGVVVMGPAPQTLIDPVQPNDLRRAVLGILREWWSPPFPDPARFHSSEYQAYAILTMCRALYTLQYGTVVSKPVAARWAQKALGEPWAALIELALAWRHDAQLDRLNETLDFIRYTLERSHQFEIPTDEA